VPVRNLPPPANRSRDRRARALGLLLAAAADRLLGDPRRWHPVAGFGSVAAALERRDHRDSRLVGAAHTAGLVGVVLAGGAVAEVLTRNRFVWRTAVTAVAGWVVLGGRSLHREALAISGQLAAGDLPAAREQVTHLVGRDTAEMDAADITRATVESIAENTADAVVSPLLIGAVLGIPGLLGYRAVNTLDAMIGHRSPRYERFGWAAARLDDVVNLLPARICVLLVALTGPTVGGSPRDALRAAIRDGGGHPSPNAGPVEAAFAGALGRTLGGVNVYRGVTEDRGTLGRGPRPEIQDIVRVAQLSAVVSAAATALAVLVAAVPWRRRSA
jgi:adenosylcobinamide-phosphate synthase